MKPLISLIFAGVIFLSSACKNGTNDSVEKIKCPEVSQTAGVPDTVLVHVPNQEDIVLRKQVEELKLENQRLYHAIDSIAVVNDTLAKRLLHARLVISNVKYYLNICMRNPTQDKFLKGWIRRAVSE